MTSSDADTVVAVVLATDIAADSPPRRLTRAERAEVDSLMIDSGYTRAEALAWVRELGVGVGS